MEASGSSASLSRVPTLRMDAPWDWDRVLAGPSRAVLEDALAEGLPARRWFGSKARRIAGLRILEAIRWNARVRLTLVEVHFESGPDEIYQLPLAFASGETAARLLAGAAAGLWARVLLANPDEPAMLFDAPADPAFCDELLARVRLRRAARRRSRPVGGLAIQRVFSRARRCRRGASHATVAQRAKQ